MKVTFFRLNKWQKANKNADSYLLKCQPRGSSSSKFLGSLSTKCILRVLRSGKQSLDLGAVVGVSHEVGQLLAHVVFAQLVDLVKRIPELLFDWLGSAVIEFDSADSEGVQDTHGGLETLVAFEVSQLASLGHDVNVDAWLSTHIEELIAVLFIFM